MKKFKYAVCGALVQEDKTQAWLAKQIGVNEGTLSYWINEVRHIRADKFLEICRLLKIDPLTIEFTK